MPRMRYKLPPTNRSLSLPGSPPVAYRVGVGRIVRGRTASRMPGLDIAEQRSWQNFLEAGLRLCGTLNRGLSEQHQLGLVDVRLLEILHRSETGSSADGRPCRTVAGAAQSGDPADSPVGIQRTGRQREASPDDGRGVLASITDQGRVIVEEAMVTYANGVRELYLGPLTRPQMSNMGEIAGESAPP